MARRQPVSRTTRRAGSSDADLSPELHGLELDAHRAQRLRTAEILKTGRLPLHVLQIAEEAVLVAEQALAKARRSHRPPALACQEGCDWCCHLTVGTTAAEVLRIVTYLRQALSPEAFHALRERVARLDEQRRAQKAARTGGPVPCPLLVEHRCAAYAVRPLTCRGFNSRDARRCEQFLTNRSVAVPSYLPQARVHTFVLDGMREGLVEAKLSGDLLELTAALRVALEMPDAAERWLTGEAVFASARLG
jgi:Fe-S-cluster containining protein